MHREELENQNQDLRRAQQNLQLKQGELEEERHRYQMLFDFAPDGYLVTDLRGRIQEANLAACQLLQQDRRSLVGAQLLLFMPEQDVRVVRGLISDFGKGRSPDCKQVDVSLHHGSHSSITCALTINEVKKPNGPVTGLRWLLHDITERKQAEDALRQAQQRLRTIVDELEHFSYTITHDLRAPLRAMSGFAKAVKEDCEERLEEQDRTLLSLIITAAGRMDALITDALSYTNAVRNELPLAAVDLENLLRGMLESYPELQAWKERIRLEGTLPTVLGNQAGLTQCFSNLLANAVKFVKPGEVPEVRVWAEERKGTATAELRQAARHESAHGQATTPKPDDEGWVRIWVEDKGIGIAKEFLPKVFHMFSRGSWEYEGTGMGLALVRKVTQRMGGRVGVESEKGKGSRFWLELRRAEA